MIKKTYLQVIILIFYAVGTVGILYSQTKPLFLKLTVFHLLLSFIIIALGREQRKKDFLIFLLISFFIGFFVEWIGIHTGFLFGDYAYGENLGLKLFGVPLIIGCNWGIVVVSAAAIANRIFKNKKWVPLIAALLMVLLDVFMEPVAMKSDFWSWKNDTIPFYNYICWALLGLLLQLAYQRNRLWEENKVNDTLFITMLVFFIILNLGS